MRENGISLKIRNKGVQYLHSYLICAEFLAIEMKQEKRNIKATEANRRSGPGTREKVSSRRINLEGNTHVQESNASQLPV
jgi:hypothetical protein